MAGAKGLGYMEECGSIPIRLLQVRVRHHLPHRGAGMDVPFLFWIFMDINLIYGYLWI